MCFSVSSPNTRYTEEYIYSRYNYLRTQVKRSSTGDLIATPISKEYVFRTDRKVPKLGVMLVGLGGNNGSTVLGGVLANRHNITWKTKSGVHKPDFVGSLTQASTTRLGNTAEGEDIYVPFKDVLPMVKPTDIEIGGWDISNTNMKQAMTRAEVLDFDLQRQLAPYMEKITPLPSIYYPSFIAANQEDRADHLIDTREYASLEHLDQLRQDIRDFKKSKKLDKVIVLWTANTERYCKVIPGIHDTEENLMRGIEEGHPEIAPSQMFAMAALLEGCSYINGSPQNTLVNAIVETAERVGQFVGGDDFKSGQTKFKSVLVDFLVSAGIKPESIVSYNHLGNNDGKNLNAPQTFRSKELSKSNVVDDMVASNEILYPIDKKTGKQAHPDHTVVIKYVPYVKDSKRAMDEYTSSIFLGGKNTLVVHNTCEDSLLAAPIILDLILLTELFERIHVAELPTQKTDLVNGFSETLLFNRLDSVLSVLSYLLKAPRVPKGTPVINALSRQRSCLENIMRACLGMPAENCMLLEHKLPNQIVEKIEGEREVCKEGITQGSRCCAPLSPN